MTEKNQVQQNTVNQKQKDNTGTYMYSTSAFMQKLEIVSSSDTLVALLVVLVLALLLRPL